MPIFNTEVKTLVSRLQLNVNKDAAFNMYDYMDCATLDVVCRKWRKRSSSLRRRIIVNLGFARIIIDVPLPTHFPRRDHSGHSHEYPEEREHELLERG